MTPKQKAFVQEYLIDLNATQAAIRAGYSPKTAQEQSSRLLSNVMVQEEIQNAMDERSQRTEITADRVLQELAKIGFSDVRKLFSPGGSLLPVSDLDDEAAACLSSIEITTRKARGGDDDELEEVAKVRLWDKPGALVSIGRHLGMFKDKVEHSGNIQLDQVQADADAFTRAVTGIAARTRAEGGAGETQH